MTVHWGEKRYYSLDYYLKKTYGEKLYKISLDGGMTCPNRDGTLGTHGCIFCSRGGSGDFAASRTLSVTEQIEAGKQQSAKKYTGSSYIAYFQAYTNTYASLEYLETLYMEAITHPDIRILSIATRPDCLSEKILDLLENLNRIKPVWVELGLQTIHPDSATFIRRGYELSVFLEAVENLRRIGISVIVHVILGLPGEDADGVLSAVQFLRSVGKDEIIDLTGKEVVVIGGGNVSMDAVRTAKRLGAKKVSILYRRRRNDMTALPGEIEGAIAEGIEIVTLKAPASLDVGEDHKIHGIYATPQMISAIRDGRASVKPTGEPDVYIPCDVLIKAIGQDIESGHFEKAGIPVSRGKIVTLKSGAFENMPGVFAGGDCSSGPASVIKAIAAAKVIAANIDEYLGYHHEITSGVEIPEASLKDKIPCGRVNLTERDAGERVCDFNAVENCMTEKEAKQEAGRCLRCDHFGYGIFKGGRSTLW